MERPIAALVGLRRQLERDLERARADEAEASEKRRVAEARVTELEADLVDVDAAIALLQPVAPLP